MNRNEVFGRETNTLGVPDQLTDNQQEAEEKSLPVHAWEFGDFAESVGIGRKQS